MDHFKIDIEDMREFVKTCRANPETIAKNPETVTKSPSSSKALRRKPLTDYKMRVRTVNELGGIHYKYSTYYPDHFVLKCGQKVRVSDYWPKNGPPNEYQGTLRVESMDGKFLGSATEFHAY